MRSVRIVDGAVVTADGYGRRAPVPAIPVYPDTACWDATLDARVKCSFCGDRDAKLVSGDRAYICRRCASLSLDIFAATAAVGDATGGEPA